MIEINKKITHYEVLKEKTPESVKPDQMHEGINRPEALEGKTYKIKPPQAEHALYVTINDMVLNAGTEHETRQPFEIFLNSKNAEHTQWTAVLTRVMSAVFRKGGDVSFLINELRCIHDPQGGYFRRNKYIPSLVSEIGDILEMHLQKNDVVESDVEKDHDVANADVSEFPESAVVCTQCSVKARVVLDGCLTCLSCGFSKCG
jgi:hypothetical protein